MAIAAGARYWITRPDEAEIAFIVADAYQKQGVGTAILKHLCSIGRPVTPGSVAGVARRADRRAVRRGAAGVGRSSRRRAPLSIVYATDHRVLRPVGLSLLMLELLWLFYGFGGLHVHSAPCLRVRDI